VVFAVLFGFLKDIVSFLPFGFFSLNYFLSSFFLAFFSKNFEKSNLLAQILLFSFFFSFSRFFLQIEEKMLTLFFHQDFIVSSLSPLNFFCRLFFNTLLVVLILLLILFFKSRKTKKK